MTPPPGGLPKPRDLGAWLEQAQRGALWAASLVLLGTVMVLDHATGWELSLTLFYLVPILLASYYGGRGMGMVVAALAGCSWLVLDVVSRPPYHHPGIAVWNAAAAFGLFLVSALVLSELRARLDQEKHLARTDPLTGLLNRRAFFEAGRSLLALCARSAQPAALLYVDLDRFKEVNDQLGHVAGDLVLRRCGRVLTSGLRGSDLVARLGGDEFALFLPMTNAEGAEEAAQRLIERFEQEFRNDRFPIGASIGGVVVEPGASTLDQAVLAADARLYEVKDRGRGAISIGTLSPEGEAPPSGEERAPPADPAVAEP